MLHLLAVELLAAAQRGVTSCNCCLSAKLRAGHFHIMEARTIDSDNMLSLALRPHTHLDAVIARLALTRVPIRGLLQVPGVSLA